VPVAERLIALGLPALTAAPADEEGEVHATSNHCSHLDCLLSSGKVIDEGLLCS
jgi:nitrite reductase/ring-hydroxylating ferredoxin subunit